MQIVLNPIDIVVREHAGAKRVDFAPSIDLSPTLSFFFDFAINRLVAARAAPRAFSTVADVTVQVTFVDYTGARHTVPGRVGRVPDRAMPVWAASPHCHKMGRC